MYNLAEILGEIEKFGKYPPYSGGCYKLHLHLMGKFPTAKGFYNSNHVVTQINDLYFDKNGLVPQPEVQVGNYLPIETFGYGFMNKAFNELL